MYVDALVWYTRVEHVAIYLFESFVDNLTPAIQQIILYLCFGILMKMANVKTMDSNYTETHVGRVYLIFAELIR